MALTPIMTLAIGSVGFVVATIIDHYLGLSCPNVRRVGVRSWELFPHKIMYMGLGAGIMYLLLR